MGCERGALTVGLICALAAAPTAADQDAPSADQRRQMPVERVAQMVTEIAAMARATADQVGRSQFSGRVMDAMAKVPRHRFVPEELAHRAYGNHPLPIGDGQTISQPYIVALSTELIEPEPDDVVLEIGTGSGYQAAVLAELVRQVHSVEIVERLARESAARLAALGYDNVEVLVGDGYQGRPDKAPFDGIIVTAGAPVIPEPLLQQLKPGGRMVIPVGPQHGAQDLMLIEKAADGSLRRKTVIPVRFVPFTGRGVEGSAGTRP